jgi:hypothetical protein
MVAVYINQLMRPDPWPAYAGQGGGGDGGNNGWGGWDIVPMYDEEIGYYEMIMPSSYMRR